MHCRNLQTIVHFLLIIYTIIRIMSFDWFLADRRMRRSRARHRCQGHRQRDRRLHERGRPRVPRRVQFRGIPDAAGDSD